MPWNDDHKPRSREKILTAAALLFTQKGFDDVSIDDVMKAAGLTRGAFYAHFKSKSDIYHHAVLFGAQRAEEYIQYMKVGNLVEFAEVYLQIGNRESELEYCVLAFLITDITQRDNVVRAAYTKVLRGYQGILATLGISHEIAVQASVVLIGGLAMSRAVTDARLKRDILDNCMLAIKKLAGS